MKNGINKENVLEALKQIIDPDLGQDIVVLNFIKKLTIDNGKVSFDIELTTAACPIKEQFKTQAEELVSALEGVTAVHVTMTGPQKKTHLHRENSGLNNVQTIIGVSSCKGGVGKSTVAALLAKETAARGFKVGLLDLDLFGPSVPTLFHLHERARLGDAKKFIPFEKDGLKLMSFGFLIGEAPAVMRGPIATSYTQQLLHNTEWGDLDYLFLDMPPGTGDIQLTITQSVPLHGAVIITTRQALSLADVAKGILMFERVNVPILGVIENMVYYTCDGCEKKHYLFGGGEVSKLKETFGLETLGQLPLQNQWMHELDLAIQKPLLVHMVDQLMRSVGKVTQRATKVPEVIFDDKQIHLKWSDGTSWDLANKDLRLSCRCAHCVEELTGQQILKPEDVPEDIKAEEVEVLGNYAIAIKWSDGHASGIYPYQNMVSM
jgi:Mrp family chromosome partitioning ATPase/DUF971 family protein